MSHERFTELVNWTNQDKWPKWEMVMYVNKVSVEESLSLLARVGSPVTFKIVKDGIEAYTGKVVKHDFINHSSIYTLVDKATK